MIVLLRNLKKVEGLGLRKSLDHMEGGDPVSIADGSKNGQKVPQVGGNGPVAPKPPSQIGGNNPGTPRPPKQTNAGGNYGGPGHKFP